MDRLKPKSSDTEYRIMAPLLLLGDGFFTLAYTISSPYISLYIIKNTHYQSATIGLVVGLSTFIGVLCAFVGGYLSDHIGRTKLIYYSLLVISSAYFFYYLSTICLSNISLLIMFMLLGGTVTVLTSVYHPVSRAFLADYVPLEKKAKYFQLLYMASNAGGILAPLFAVFLGIAATPIAFIISAVLYFLYAQTILKLTKQINCSQHLSQNSKATIVASGKLILSDIRFAYYIFSGFAFCICCSQFDSSLSLYLNTFSINAVKVYSMLIVTNSLTIVLSQWVIFRLTKKYSASNLISIGYLIVALGFCLIGISHGSLNRLFLGVVIMSAGQVLVFPNYNRFIDSISPPHLKGAYFGASFLRLFGCGVGPIMGGYFLKYYNGEILFLITSLIAVLASLLQALTRYSADVKVANA